MLWTCGFILWGEYAPNFHHKQRDRANQQRPSQMNNPASGKLGKLSSGNENL